MRNSVQSNFQRQKQSSNQRSKLPFDFALDLISNINVKFKMKRKLQTCRLRSVYCCRCFQ